MIARGKFVRGDRAGAASRLKAHLKYIEYRCRDEDETREDRYIFGKDSDHVDRKDALSDVMEHTSTSVNYHIIVLSPSEDEPVEDWQTWTREVLRDLEEAQDKELHWYAVHHDNTEHPHVHVILAGAGEDRETGDLESVKLYLEDYEQLRISGREHSEHEFYAHIAEHLEELDREEDPVVQERVEPSQEYEPIFEP